MGWEKATNSANNPKDLRMSLRVSSVPQQRIAKRKSAGGQGFAHPVQTKVTLLESLFFTILLLPFSEQRSMVLSIG